MKIDTAPSSPRDRLWSVTNGVTITINFETPEGWNRATGWFASLHIPVSYSLVGREPVKERAPHIEWSTITAGGAAIIGTLPHGEGSVLVFQYSPHAYTLRHNGRMVRSDLTTIEDICDAIASLANKPVLRAG